MITVKKIGWWLDSVRGLRAHIMVYREMQRAAARDLPDEASPEALKKFNEQMRQHQALIGSCLLSVLLVHPVGSGRFWD